MNNIEPEDGWQTKTPEQIWDDFNAGLAARERADQQYKDDLLAFAERFAHITKLHPYQQDLMHILMTHPDKLLNATMYGRMRAVPVGGAVGKSSNFLAIDECWDPAVVIGQIQEFVVMDSWPQGMDAQLPPVVHPKVVSAHKHARAYPNRPGPAPRKKWR